MSKRVLAVCATTVLLSVPLARPSAAQAPDITCESTLSGTVELQADVDCEGGGEISLADGLDLDLNGFAIRARVYSDEFARFNVADGEIDDLRLLRATATLNDVGIDGISMNGSTVDALRVEVGDVSLSISTPSDVRFRDSRIGAISSCGDCTADIEGSRIGFLGDAYDARLRLVDNEIGSLEAQESSWELRDNRVGGLIHLFDPAAAVVSGNRFDGPDSQLHLNGMAPDTEVVDNTFTAGKGLLVEYWRDGAALTIAGNRFVGNLGTGLAIDRATDGPAVDFSIAVTANRFVANAGSGLSVRWGDQASVVTVGGNVAARNGGHGIDAPGVTDGDGNRAAGNAADPACIGVTCAPK